MNFGQLGIPFSPVESVSTCGVASCAPVSTVKFIAFSDNKVAISEIAAGQSHTCALFTSGGMICFGKNDFGQLGVESTVNIAGSLGAPLLTQKTIGGAIAHGIESMALGFSHTCVVRCGSVYCFGKNDAGQIGTGTTAASVGTTANDMSSLAPLAFDAGTVLPRPSLLSLVLAPGSVSVPLNVCQTFYNVIATDANDITVASHTLSSGASVKFRGASPALGYTLNPHFPTLIRVSVSISLTTVTYTIAVRRTSTGPTIGTGATSSCLLSGGRVLCWGVRKIHQLISDIVFFIIIFFFFARRTRNRNIGRNKC